MDAAILLGLTVTSMWKHKACNVHGGFCVLSVALGNKAEALVGYLSPVHGT